MATFNYTSTLVQETTSLIKVSTTYEVADITPPVVSSSGTFTNTITANAYNVGSFNFIVPPVTPPRTIQLPSTSFGTPMPTFLDGVYRYTASVVYDINVDEFQNTYNTNSYIVVTQNIDALYINFLSGYDPNNPADVYYNNLLLDYFGQITTLSSNLATNYEAINDLIEQIQAILNQEVQEVYFVLVNPSEFIINYGLNNLPSGTYTDQLLTITQLGTDNEYDILNFPNDDTDVTTTVSSEDFNGSEEYPDGVYLLSGTYTVDGEIYTVEEHALVLTGIDSGMAAFGVKLACACSERLAIKGCTLLTYYDAIERTFAAGEYTSTITLIKKLQNLLNNQGCGCNC
jgi:hypothetical protein